MEIRTLWEIICLQKAVLLSFVCKETSAAGNYVEGIISYFPVMQEWYKIKSNNPFIIFIYAGLSKGCKVSKQIQTPSGNYPL